MPIHIYNLQRNETRKRDDIIGEILKKRSYSRLLSTRSAASHSSCDTSCSTRPQINTLLSTHHGQMRQKCINESWRSLAQRAIGNTRTRDFFRHSYSSPTPSITTLQDIGLCISKAFAAHIHNATWKFGDWPPAVPRTYVPVPCPKRLLAWAIEK